MKNFIISIIAFLSFSVLHAQRSFETISIGDTLFQLRATETFEDGTEVVTTTEELTSGEYFSYLENLATSLANQKGRRLGQSKIAGVEMNRVGAQIATSYPDTTLSKLMKAKFGLSPSQKVFVRVGANITKFIPRAGNASILDEDGGSDRIGIAYEGAHGFRADDLTGTTLGEEIDFFKVKDNQYYGEKANGTWVKIIIR